MLPLKPTFTPNPPWRRDRVIQSGFDEDSTDCSVADRRDLLNLVVS